jgi:hypothetical protein
MILRGMGAQPADGTLHIIELRWVSVSCRSDESIIDTGRHKTAARHPHGEFIKIPLGTMGPSTPMDEDNRGQNSIFGGKRSKEIEHQLLAVRFAIGDVELRVKISRRLAPQTMREKEGQNGEAKRGESMVHHAGDGPSVRSVSR